MTSDNQLNSPIRQQLQQNFEFIEKKLNDSKSLRTQSNLIEKYKQLMGQQHQESKPKMIIPSYISPFENFAKPKRQSQEKSLTKQANDLAKQYKSKKLRNKANQRSVQEVKKTPQISQDFQNFQSTKKALFFTPKSQRLNQPMLFEFDLYIRAATEIQRHFRGYLQRMRICGGFKIFREIIVKLQRLCRQFIKIRRQKYKKYVEYLEIKSRKIINETKNFYKIYHKLHALQSHNELKSALQHKRTKNNDFHCRAESSRQLLETNFSKIKIQASCHQDQGIQVDLTLQQNQKINFSAKKNSSFIENFHSPQKSQMAIQEEDYDQKDQMIMSLKSEVQALRLLLFKDAQTNFSANHISQSLDQKEQSHKLNFSHGQGQTFSSNISNDDGVDFKSLQAVREKLASLQKTEVQYAQIINQEFQSKLPQMITSKQEQKYEKEYKQTLDKGKTANRQTSSSSQNQKIQKSDSSDNRKVKTALYGNAQSLKQQANYVRSHRN